jgi:hypothetical protein
MALFDLHHQDHPTKVMRRGRAIRENPQCLKLKGNPEGLKRALKSETEEDVRSPRLKETQ